MILKKKLNQDLKKYGIKAKKRLGQNFIFDFNILEKIVRSSLPIDKNTILEIGPGPGGLTKAILKHNPKELILVEIDKKFEPLLKQISEEFNNKKIKIIYDDFLNINYQKLCSHKLKIFSNLPYYISTKILLKILPLDKNIAEVLFTFQKEVGLRLLAKPNSKSYSRLSIITQYACNIKIIQNLPANVFYPIPKVDSIVVKLTPKKNINKNIFNKLQVITQLAFGKRRKVLKNSLAKISNIDYLLKKIGVSLNARAEDLSIDQYIMLSKTAEL